MRTILTPWQFPSEVGSFPRACLPLLPLLIFPVLINIAVPISTRVEAQESTQTPAFASWHGNSLDAAQIQEFFRERNQASPQIDQWFRDLADSNFAVRRNARRQLSQADMLPVRALVSNAATADPEIRFFVEQLAGQFKLRDSDRLAAALWNIGAKQIKGLGPQLRELGKEFSQDETEFLRWMLPIAVAASAIESDRNWLAEFLESDNGLQQRMAIWGLVALAKQRVGDQSVPAFDLHPIDSALAGVSAGDMRSIDLLIELLDSADRLERVLAVRCLESVSGQWYGHIGMEQSSDRQDCIEAWRAWWTSTRVKQPQLAEISLQHLIPGLRLKGHQLLLVDPPGQKPAESDPKPATLGFYADFRLIASLATEPCSWLQPIPNSTHWLALMQIDSQPTLVELNESGEILWRFERTSISSFRLLANGNLLVSCGTDRRLIEVRRSDKHIVWGMVTPGTCFDAVSSPTGELFLGTGDGLLLLAADGSESLLWEETAVNRIQIMADGNLLLVATRENKLLAVTPEGTKLWELEIQNPRYAQQQWDGAILVASAQGFEVYDANRQLIETIQVEGLAARARAIFR